VNEPINNGGPAFPMYSRDESRDIPGMTLRDYFASQALQGFLAHPHYRGLIEDNCRDAFRFADAMLIAREERG